MGEAKPPPLRARKSKLSGPPCKGETRERSDDAATIGSSFAASALRERAREARDEEQSSRCRLPGTGRRASGNCSDEERSRTLSPREPSVEEGRAPARRLGEGCGERQGLSPLEEGQLAVLTIACKEQLAAPSYCKEELQFLRPTSRCNLLHRPPLREVGSRSPPNVFFFVTRRLDGAAVSTSPPRSSSFAAAATRLLDARSR